MLKDFLRKCTLALERGPRIQDFWRSWQAGRLAGWQILDFLKDFLRICTLALERGPRSQDFWKSWLGNVGKSIILLIFQRKTFQFHARGPENALLKFRKMKAPSVLRLGPFFSGHFFVVKKNKFVKNLKLLYVEQK